VAVGFEALKIFLFGSFFIEKLVVFRFLGLFSLFGFEVSVAFLRVSLIFFVIIS